MRIRLAAVVLLCACSSPGSRDARIEAARDRVRALDAGHAAQIAAFCSSWHRDGALSVDELPAALPVPPTSARAHDGAIDFAWWNNSHYEEDRPHPGFELICSARPVPGATPIAPTLWYRDAPMAAE